MRHVCVDHFTQLLKDLSFHIVHIVHRKQFQTLFMDLLDRSKAAIPLRRLGIIAYLNPYDASNSQQLCST